MEDGRRASFRHTFFHRIARIDFLERRDEVAAISASYIATACMASNPRIGVDRAIEIVSGMRLDLVKSMFPYLDLDREEKPKSYEDYSEYFDELDKLDAEAKTEQNDIISEEK